MVRQKLVGDERIVRPTPDHVGKGTAAINPKFPSTVCCHAVCCHAVCLNGLSIRHCRPYTEKLAGPGGVFRQAPSMHQPAYKPGSVGGGRTTPPRRAFLFAG